MTNLHPRSDTESLTELRRHYNALNAELTTAQTKLREFILENKRLRIQILQQELEELENENS